MESKDIQTGQEYWCKSLKKRVTVVAYTQGDIYAVVYDGQEDIPVLIINLESLDWDGKKIMEREG